jgi:hypothetical protein
MKVRYRKQFGFPLSNPVLPVFPLAFRTMPIPTAIIADTHRSAFGASIYVPSEVCRAASFQRRQGSELPTVYLWVLFHLCPVLSKHIGHFKISFHFLDR